MASTHVETSNVENTGFWYSPSAAITAFCTAALIIGSGTLSGSQAQVNGRGLEISRIAGEVTYLRNGTRAANVGDRLESVGHGINTGRRSSAVLAIDGGGIGTVTVAENTHLVVTRLETSNDGGIVTILDVSRGQARVRARPFTNPSSRLELHTPSGVAAVRGTEFGVSVSETGKTSIGTLEGAVAASAEGATVRIEADFASVIPPGEPPTAPMPLDRLLEFDLISLYPQDNSVFIEGYVNPVNSVFIEGQEVPVSLTGQVRVTIPSSTADPITVMVINPLGESQNYHLSMR